MRHVDALSRFPVVCMIDDGILKQIRKAQSQDEYCQTVLEVLKEKEYKNFISRNDILYKFSDGDYLLVVPKAMEKGLIRALHEPGHISKQKLEAMMKHEYFIPNIGRKIEKVLTNCVPCILSEKKKGLQEGFLNPIEKIDTPLHTYHVDHLGPLPSTSKQYKYLFVVIDAFTKFCWIYPVKDVTSQQVIKKLEIQRETFGNPFIIISDKGTAFTSNMFKDYCKNNLINHMLVTTGVPRGNGQVERLNQTIIRVLTKLSVENPKKWYQYVPRLQIVLNSNISRATGRSPFELLMGIKMRKPEDVELGRMIEEEIIEQFEQNRSELRKEAKEQIAKIQNENRRTFNQKRKEARRYAVSDLVALKKTQFEPGSKLYPKYVGPYEVVKVRRNDRYDLKRVGIHEGPLVTSSAADHMKPWSNVVGSSSESDEE